MFARSGLSLLQKFSLYSVVDKKNMPGRRDLTNIVEKV